MLFTFSSLVSTIILNKGLNAPATGIISIVCAFLTICIGITILQLSKIDPRDLSKQPGVDRRTTLLLKASRSHVRHDEKEKTPDLTGQAPEQNHLSSEREPHVLAEGEVLADPGPDTIRGGLGVVGSIIRAHSVVRSRSNRYSRQIGPKGWSDRHSRAYALDERSTDTLTHPAFSDGRARYRLYDDPMGSHSCINICEEVGVLANTHLAVPAADGFGNPATAERMAKTPSTNSGPERKVTFSRAALEHDRSGRSAAASDTHSHNPVRSITSSAGSFNRSDTIRQNQNLGGHGNIRDFAQTVRVPSARSTAARAGSFSHSEVSPDTSVEEEQPSERHGWGSLLMPRLPSRRRHANDAPNSASVLESRAASETGRRMSKAGIAADPLPGAEETGLAAQVSDDWGFGYHTHLEGQDSVTSLPLNILQPTASSCTTSKLNALMSKDEGTGSDNPYAPDFQSISVGATGGERTGAALRPELAVTSPPDATCSRTSRPSFYYNDPPLTEQTVDLAGKVAPTEMWTRDTLPSPQPARHRDLLAPQGVAVRSSVLPYAPSRRSTAEDIAYADTGVVEAYRYADSAPSSLRGKEVSPSPPPPPSSPTTATP